MVDDSTAVFRPSRPEWLCNPFAPTGCNNHKRVLSVVKRQYFMERINNVGLGSVMRNMLHPFFRGKDGFLGYKGQQERIVNETANIFELSRLMAGRSS